ncbi:uncharacterized protein BDR25DRAFT_347794 [Lindgomyces ingoldianus]|uniref:Uncharacterized protein n=1 Tax=Lindgomyces ingoldianus TaxID=673940 RepID=A0ACB6RFD1_9PLEO|nr:uncharacterized protein BDR25DRAFT_347794 [Lindgomyces ingoldianus]KAF2477430.1 hypothetical protein BDR25DRAFT_347794 [Lindgomyces ingoldianus]
MSEQLYDNILATFHLTGDTQMCQVRRSISKLMFLHIATIVTTRANEYASKAEKYIRKHCHRKPPWANESCATRPSIWTIWYEGGMFEVNDLRSKCSVGCVVNTRYITMSVRGLDTYMSAGFRSRILPHLSSAVIKALVITLSPRRPEGGLELRFLRWIDIFCSDLRRKLILVFNILETTGEGNPWEVLLPCNLRQDAFSASYVVR